jgi:hypothetical protein
MIVGGKSVYRREHFQYWFTGSEATITLLLTEFTLDREIISTDVSR